MIIWEQKCVFLFIDIRMVKLLEKKLLGYKPFISVEGFLTDKGDFLDRWEAADHAYECGQLVETAEEPRIDRLISEDLW